MAADAYRKGGGGGKENHDVCISASEKNSNTVNFLSQLPTEEKTGLVCLLRLSALSSMLFAWDKRVIHSDC